MSQQEKINEQNQPLEKKNFWKKLFHSPSKYIAIAIISLIIILLVVANYGFNYLISYQNAFFITSFIWICISILSLVSRDGFFRIFSYSGYYIKHKFLQRPMNNYHDYYFIQEKKKDENRYSWTPYLVSGLILLVISCFFMIIISLKY